MSTDQIDEYEQGERVRSWLKNNGASLITGVALGLACIGAWQWWQARDDNHRVDAAAQYLAFTEALEAKDTDKASALSTSLRQQYGKTPFAALSALRTARVLHDEGKTDDAIKALDSVSHEGIDPAIAELLTLRAARLLVGQGKNEEAVKRLDSVPETRYPAISWEIRGDAEVALGHQDAARKAYEEALTALDVAAPTRPILEMKLTDAGGKPPAQPEI